MTPDDDPLSLDGRVGALDLFFDRNGNPISVLEWTRLKFEVDGYGRIVGTYLLTPTDERLWLSTVWLGISVWPDRHDLFETMLFLPGYSDHWREETRWQYPTEEEASAAHEVILAGLLAEGYRIDPDQSGGQHA